ncbi:hypothetical protein D3C73_1169030 [compost metagenome]
MFQSRTRQQAQVAVMQAVEQSILHHAILDDMSQPLGMHTGGTEMDLPGATAVPHMHVRIRAAASFGDAFPGAQPLENPLAGCRQRAHPRLERRLCVEGFDRHRAAVQQQDVQPAVA